MTGHRIYRDTATGLVLDLTDGPPLELGPSAEQVDAAVRAMEALEAGAVANVDEQRQVGHYWLRDPSLAPSNDIRRAIRGAWSRLEAGDLVPSSFHTVLLVGIGGSALGPRFVARALESSSDPRRLVCLDNTDPEGFATVLGSIDPTRTVVVVVSKSGGTTETRNGMLATMAAYEGAGVPFHEHAIAITGPGSALDDLARRSEAPWRAVFAIYDWVGGRTSVTGPVGLVPMALCGWDWREFLAGAWEMDASTRRPDPSDNPALQLAAAWYAAGNGKGDRALVMLPYRDRLGLLGQYLQQLVMESIGKRIDRAGRRVDQGLTVYGNKGSTDQHAYVQQVRDGRDDSFVHFIDTLHQGPRVPVDDGFFADDHLVGFLLGTRAALRERDRPSVSIRVCDTSARSLGQLVALFERAVGFYAELIDINAYHQPGVEGGKRGAKVALAMLRALQDALGAEPRTVFELVQPDQDRGMAWRLLHHLAATGRAVVERDPTEPFQDRFSAVD
jgi:glucose-6-phosphate isomerase